jgi:DNA-binding beta-propeller fold protein YncE
MLASLRLRSLVASVSLAALLGPLSAGAQTSFVAFESGQVRPLALSPDGTKLFAVNTPDNRLEVFTVGAGTLTHADSIPVGMEPVAVAPRNNTEVWVVNHLSDSVSVVDLTATPPRVVRTLIVGDEPRDIVFAGTGGNRAFISTAHRGQHRTHGTISGVTGAGDPQLTTEGIGRADVWVFDATNLGTTLGGTPIRILSFFADTPRALATDGTTVYVAAFHSGNQTTTVNETAVCNGFQFSGGTNCQAGAPGGVLPPTTNCLQTDGDPACEQATQAPETGIIVKWNGSAWRDSAGRDWTSTVSFDLPDHDVFAFDANTLVAGTVFDHVGTILFNMVVNPTTGRVYVTNTELPNHVRFEGPGIHGGSTVQGHLSESRISVLNPGTGAVDPQHLNQHIDYGQLHTDAGANHAAIDAQKAHSLATPTQAVVSTTGTVYLAAFGSSKIGVFSTGDLEDPLFETSFDPTVESANYISTAGGPSGLALDETHGRLYVLARFDNTVRVIDTTTKATLETHWLHNPEPTTLVEGRPFLYDAQISSGNGETACASCHIFGDLDSLAWDLGDPDAAVTTNSQPEAIPILPDQPTFHPMKGPMTTQTLRGMATHGALHWRGDRVDGFFGVDACTEPSGAPCSEDFSFRNFIVAFEGLLGKHGTISNAQMQDFSDFMLQVMLPPNPVRPLNNTLSGDAASGNTLFNGANTDTVANCNGCHTLNPGQGFFGSGGRRSFEGEPQDAKVPHMRNLYAKIGMFGLPGEAHTGDQIRGFGFLHDGSVDTVHNFLEAPVFTTNATQEGQLEQFALAFPSDLAPIVGQQVTLITGTLTGGTTRIDLMETRAGTAFTSLLLGPAVTECDVVVKGTVGGVERGWRRESGTSPANTVYRDDTNQTLSGAALRALVNTEGPLTYTCAPPGSGQRMGIDRDLDTVLDGLDNCPAVANPGQEDLNSNQIGDACESGIPDADLDGVADALDNCPNDANPGQEDFDGDGPGDACDPDDDNDGLLDVVETNTGTFVSASDTGSNPFDTDSDDDGISDLSEVLNHTDPNDPDSPGPPIIPMMPLWGTLLLVGLVIYFASRMLKRGGGAKVA